MSAEQLTCVWQAVYSKRWFNGTGKISKDALHQVMCSLTAIPYLKYAESTFNEAFQELTVDFEDYKQYVNLTLRPEHFPIRLLYDDIEHVCWNLCRELYTTCTDDEPDIKKLWEISNRLVMKNSYPPIVSCGDAQWFLDQLFVELDGIKISRFTEDATLTDIVQKLESGGVNINAIRMSIDHMYRLLVVEECKSGLVKSRCRNKANWTAWSMTWCTLTSTKIFFHDKPLLAKDCRNKGQLIIGKETKIEILTAGTDLTGRFRICNVQAVEYDIALGNDDDRDGWIIAIQDAKEICHDKLTPVQQSIRQLSQHHRSLSEVLAAFGKRKLKIRKTIPSTQEHTNVQAKDTSTSKQINVTKTNKDKIKSVFMKIDMNGNGFIERSEFGVFIASMGLNMSQEEKDVVFNSVDKNNDSVLCYEEFEKYLIDQVLSETTDTDAVNAMRVAFMEADRNKSGKIDFQEFSDYLWEQKRTGRVMKFQEALAKMQLSDTEEIDIHQFENIIGASGSDCGLSFNRSVSLIDDLEHELKVAFEETNAYELVKLINERWNSFITFDRKGSSGKTVMTSDHVVMDVIPGEYNLVDLACFTDIAPLEPNHIILKDTKWVASNVPGTSGKITLPSHFNGYVPTETATNEFLRFYGCSFADSGSQKVSLLHRHSIVDFTYENDYFTEYAAKNGGIETHQFSHLDCPMSRDSGVFVLGKYTDNGDLYLTGFKIPARHVLYVPAGCIHSNDHMKGTWRTMLSDEADIDHVHLMKDCEHDEISTLNFKFA